ncbi:Crp/Fnr family transcriptional regulator [Nitratireductor thuwali]|uniref:Nitrogen fixation regulation protein FixK n=1 Tax=Nitratireductor thuwali TaxID=2267699 RepID=A0ABY5MHD2_9HYPH|nr:Nitrogen fixation regulation protein FixK [Nitratireductor thuwali]
MDATNHRPRQQVSCDACPLRKRQEFRDFSEDELAFMRRFKRGELTIDKGAAILQEGAHTPHLYTVLSGWAFRYKMMRDGRRQIVNYAMPGDMIGLQGSLMGEMQHSVEALSPMTLCVFERAELFGLFTRSPELAYDVTWIASREECMLDENLLTVGRRTAQEKIAYLVVFLWSRSVACGLTGRNVVDITLTQQHVADTLGLSLVHTNKMIRKLAERKLLTWSDGGCRILDLERLRRLAQWDDAIPAKRPFL